ncbi:MAG: sigma-70 family RNA polymerase sigma factor [Ruminococcus sp.]|nr:sigma-70 family RNA polymerase sigma factor [Ruminococcus sp.]
MDINKFEQLVRASTDTLYRVSMSMLKNEHDAQDAVSEAILKAYENLHKLRKEEYFKTWLVRILINECKLILRKSDRIISNANEKIPEITSRDNPYLSVEVGEAINSLPEKIRLVIVMFYVEDYSIKDIKRVLNIPEGTVKSRLSKGRALLKEQLL